MVKKLELFSESLIEDGAVLVKKTPPAEKDAVENRFAGTGHPSVVTDAGRDPHDQATQANVIGTKRANNSKPKRYHDMFTHFPKYPNCDVCRMTDHTCQMQQQTSKNGPTESSCHIRRAHHSGTQNLESRLQSYPTKTKDAQRTTSCLRRFLLPFQRLGRIFTNISQQVIKACQDLQWTHDTNTRHRSESIGIAERAVRRVKEGTGDSDGSTWFTRRMAGLSVGMLLLLVQRARQSGRWQDSV